ncbi:MAG: glucose ABC transporter substrate-binding protein GlcS [Thermoplasmatales archaeon]
MALSKTAIVVIVVVVVVIVAGSIAGYELTRPTTTSQNVVLYTWWATTGKVALNHLIPGFESANPGYTVTEEVSPGGGGDNSLIAVMSLISAGKPPDAFQTHYGPWTYSYVSVDPQGVNGFYNWTSYYEDNLAGHVVPSAFEAGAMNGVLLSMPVEVHTMGLLYINKNVLQHYGLPLPTNEMQLLNETKQLVKDGFYNSTEAPWGISANEGGWAQLQLWENNFLALAGPKLYNEFTYGTLNTSSPQVQSIINETDQIFVAESQYDYPGWQSMSWTQMASELVDGHIAFLTAGDFVTNYMYDFMNTTSYPAVAPYVNQSNVTVLVESFPGTSSYFVVNLDAIGVPTGPTEAAGVKFVKYWTSYTGDKIWTQWKGISYWNNVTTDYYNTPEQWYMYQKLISTPSSDFVYALSDGGLFASPYTTLTGALITLESSGSPDISSWNSQVKSEVSVEEQSWLSANSEHLGYLGFPGAPFAGYLPPWANSTFNATGSGSKAVNFGHSYSPSQPVSQQPAIHSSSVPIGNYPFKAAVVYPSFNTLRHGAIRG